MEKIKKLSVIIPAYKVEQYLPRCFDSIDQQNNDESEFIFVDDGSPDNSGNLIDEFAKKRDFVKVIHKENGGLSDARNVGLKMAIGQYCAFVDSDDILLPGAVDKIVKLQSSYPVDVIYLNIRWIKKNVAFNYGKRGFPKETIIPGKEALRLELITGKYAAMAQLGVYRTAFLKSNNLFFKKGILHEDEQWSPRVMLQAECVARVDYAYYNYYIRTNSITQSINPKRYYDLINTAVELQDIYNRCGDIIIQQYGQQYLAKLYMNAASHLITVDNTFQIDPTLYRGRALAWKERLKEILFTISPKIYLKWMEK